MPGHSRLSARTVDFTKTDPVVTNKEPGVARGGIKIAISDRLTEEGCCTVQAGSVIFDIGMRWNLNQPEANVDTSLALLQALLFNTAVISGIKTGVLAVS
jgi:hypothetical protein